jgi:hypothetical protein
MEIRMLTDFVCLYNYEFWLSLCKIVRSSVILLLPLFSLFDLPFFHIFHILNTEKYGRKASRIVKRIGKYRRKLWNDMEVSSILFISYIIQPIFLPYFSYLFTICFCIFQIFLLFDSEKDWKIQKKILKWYGRKVSWILKRFGNYGRKANWKIKRFEKYIFHIFSQFASVFFKSFYYSTCLSSIFSISFNISTYYSSIFSISFHY